VIENRKMVQPHQARQSLQVQDSVRREADMKLSSQLGPPGIWLSADEHVRRRQVILAEILAALVLLLAILMVLGH
jgi:hypothetical protein